MLDWLKNMGGKPDHPMFDAAEARRLLADLPKGDPDKALEDVAHWIVSVRGASGFRVERRFEVLGVLDVAGSAPAAAILQRYLALPNTRDFRGVQWWQALFDFSVELSEAYGACVDEFRQSGKSSTEARELLPLMLVRTMRSYGVRMKLAMLRYLPLPEALWARFYGLYRHAEEQGVADALVAAYAKEAIQSSPRRELLRVLMLALASPETMPPEQIELVARVAGRFSGTFVMHDAPDPACHFFVDLSKPFPPHVTGEHAPVGAMVRHFAAAVALPKIVEMLKLNEEGRLDKEMRLGEEFSVGQKLTALKHLLAYWGEHPPRRGAARSQADLALWVRHGYETICQTVTNIEFSGMAELTEEMQVKLRARSGEIGLAAETPELVPESWREINVSEDGLAAQVPSPAPNWVKVGALVAVQPQGKPQWMVGVIRRLQSDEKNRLVAGIQLLAKRPVAVWLRVLGHGEVQTSHWETTSGSFAYDYIHAILLPDEVQYLKKAKLLLAVDSYATDRICELMMGEHGRHIKLNVLIEQGVNFDYAGFEWLGQATAPA